MDTRTRIEQELRSIYQRDAEERTSAEDYRIDELHDMMADWATALNECQHLGCRRKTDGYSYCPDHTS